MVRRGCRARRGDGEGREGLAGIAPGEEDVEEVEVVEEDVEEVEVDEVVDRRDQSRLG